MEKVPVPMTRNAGPSILTNQKIFFQKCALYKAEDSIGTYPASLPEMAKESGFITNKRSPRGRQGQCILDFIMLSECWDFQSP